MISQTAYYDLWTLSDSEAKFYNLFYALISLILGQNVCFTIWFDRPKRFFQFKNIRRKSIVHDQRGLIWYFILWFSKLGFLYAAFFGLTAVGGHYIISLYDQYYLMFILIVFVLYFNSWNTLIRSLGKWKRKWLLTSLIAICTIAIGLAWIPIIDSKKVESSVLEKNIFRKYNLQLPQSNVRKKIYNKSLYPEVFIPYEKDGHKLDELTFLFYDKELKIDMLGESLDVYTDLNDLNYDTFRKVRLGFDKRIKMNQVYHVFDTLITRSVTDIYFIALPEVMEYNSEFYDLQGVPLRLPLYSAGVANLNGNIDSNTQISLVVDSNNLVELSDKPVSLEILRRELIKQIFKNDNPIIMLDVDGQISYDSFITIISIIRESYFQLKDEYSYELYGLNYEDIEEYSKRKKISQKYKERIILAEDGKIRWKEYNDKMKYIYK
ncbi:hypothetical protein KFE94_15665 [bacterium SCSIO 12643]|nr:hypothetical protein KFE94_15665 [bacterium SCSIO 12643]